MIEPGYDIYESGWPSTANNQLHVFYVVEHHGERFNDDYPTRKIAEAAAALHRITGFAPDANSFTHQEQLQ